MIVDNIPFFVRGIALGDIITVELEENHWKFLDVVERSGHSTIRLLIFDPLQVEQIGEELIALGCSWEGGRIARLLAVDVPPEARIDDLQLYLNEGVVASRFECEEGLVWW